MMANTTTRSAGLDPTCRASAETNSCSPLTIVRGSASPTSMLSMYSLHTAVFCSCCRGLMCCTVEAPSLIAVWMLLCFQYLAHPAQGSHSGIQLDSANHCLH